MTIEQMKYYQDKLSYEIDSADLFTALNNKDNVVVIDGRSPDAYKKEHIPGAINLWHKDMSANTTSDFSKQAIYICYCDGIGCNASTKAALKLLVMGFSVKELIGGLDWWKRDGYGTNGTDGQTGEIVNCGC